MKTLYEKNRQIIKTIYTMTQNVNTQNTIYIVDHMRYFACVLPDLISDLMEHADYFAKEGMEICFEDITVILSQMLEAQKCEDYILYVDLLRLRLLPVLLGVQEVIRLQEDSLMDNYWEQNMERLKDKDPELYRQLMQSEELHVGSVYANDIYSVEQSVVGDLTVAVSSGEERIYLHSSDNPVAYSWPLMDEYYDVYQDHYVIYGLGLGYHGCYLARKDPDLTVTILENDIGIIELAMTYTDMGWYFYHPGVRIVYDPNWTSFSKEIRREESQTVIFHQPSVRRIKNEQIVRRIQEYWVMEGSTRVFGNRMIRNFLFNVAHCDTDLSDLRKRIEGKMVIVVAAGPSLDRNVELLRDRCEDAVVLVLGAVYRKLAAMQIPMDYVIITDPKEVSDQQIAGLEQSDIPMLLLSTATKGVARLYRGKKYLLCQNGFADAERYANEHELPLFDTGGSVATTAVDVCIRFGASKIVLVGLDLAFTGNRNHAEGARDEGITNYDEMFMVEDVYGNPVPTSRPFAMYREWIERRIAREDVVMPVIDATEGGAKIAGTQVCTLREVLKNLE